jgi:hypothetical protein
LVIRVHPQTFDREQAQGFGGLGKNFGRQFVPAVAQAENEFSVG